MIIPYKLLKADTLRGVIEAFVVQEGTDYGEEEVTLETKVAQVKRQRDEGSAVIVCDEEDQSCAIVLKAWLPESLGQIDDSPGE